MSFIDNVTSSLPPNVQEVVNPLLKVKIGNINLDFSKVKFPTTKEGWQALGKKIQEELKKRSQEITLQDAINMAKRIAAKIAQQGGGQSATQTTPATQTTTPVKVQTAQTEEEVSSFIEKIMNDKRYWLGIFFLYMLLRKK